MKENERDHPNNAAARWHLSQAYQRGLLGGSLEAKARKRLDMDCTCACATTAESRAFVADVWEREVDECRE